MEKFEDLVLPPETLDEIYRQWLRRDRPDAEPRWLKYKKYTQQYRDGYNERRFEDWLWNNGFTIFQKDKKRYLKFIGEERKLTLFLLKYS
jgi:hypothetical protein